MEKPKKNLASEKTVIRSIESLENVSDQRSPALLVVAGPKIGRSIPIEKEDFNIGRVDTCDLVIEDDLVSRHHCKIISQGGEAELLDLGSTNGTLLNGKRVTSGKLKEGDQIQVGASSILKFHLQEDVEKRFLNELFEAATKDFLTSVYNKGYLMDRLQAEFFYTKRHGGNLSVLAIDIDHFKQVNDTYGHLLGDLALKKVAHYLLSHVRKDDIVSRFGGEEFVILMRDCDLQAAKRLAETLRVGLSKMDIDTPEKPIHLTVSVGAASLNEETKAKIVKFESLLEVADSKLYEAKESGRNKVVA